MFREIAVHVCLLGTSVAAALGVWAGKTTSADFPRGDTLIWEGRPEDILRIVYEGPNYKTTIESKHDAVGAYFAGKYEQTVKPGEEYLRPDNLPAFVNQGDNPMVLSQEFISTKPGTKLVNDLASLKALLAIGSVSKTQLADFGLAASKTRAIVTFRDGERKLEFGGETLGEKNQYVLDAKTGKVFVLLGDLARDISLAHERLPDRQLHAWHRTEPTSASIIGLNRTRKFVRGGTKGKLFWADAATGPDEDTAATTWMAKVDELQTVGIDRSPSTERVQLFRIEYATSDSQQGFAEVWKAPGEENRSNYWVRSEQTRGLARVLGEVGEQLEQGAKAVLK